VTKPSNLNLPQSCRGFARNQRGILANHVPSVAAIAYESPSGKITVADRQVCALEQKIFYKPLQYRACTEIFSTESDTQQDFAAGKKRDTVFKWLDRSQVQQSSGIPTR
jgi:hypothetical protein